VLALSKAFQSLSVLGPLFALVFCAWLILEVVMDGVSTFALVQPKASAHELGCELFKVSATPYRDHQAGLRGVIEQPIRALLAGHAKRGEIEPACMQAY